MNHVSQERLEQILRNKQSNLSWDGSTVEYSLSTDSIDWPEFCPVLGIKLDYYRVGRGRQGDDSPSLDRVDPTKGYTPNNVRVISNKANRIKSDASLSDLRKVLAYIEANLNS